MSITREEIRRLCIAHDRFMAEQASEPIRRPPVSETEDASLIYKDYDNGEPTAAATVEPADWSGWENWLAGHIAIEREKNFDTIADAMDHLISELRAERDAELGKVRGELVAVQTKVDVVLNLVTKGER